MTQLWPTEENSPESKTAITPAITDAFAAACAELKIAEDLSPLLAGLYLPFAAWLMAGRTDADTPLVLGVCGGQGSGKSTFSRLLAAVLDAAHGAKTAILSIDDIYKTHAARAAMARRVHPLFATRGVPGTHDVDLGVETITRLKTMTPGDRVALPRFDKAMDDRAPHGDWPVIDARPALVILEGWCVGATPQSEDDLDTPVNPLEADEDADRIWRRSVNDALINEYPALWELLDILVLLKVPSMEKIYEWRQLQEEKLAASHKDMGGPGNTRIMTPAQVTRFVAHYERLTRHILGHMPESADIIIDIGNNHQPTAVHLRE